MYSGQPEAIVGCHWLPVSGYNRVSVDNAHNKQDTHSSPISAHACCPSPSDLHCSGTDVNAAWETLEARAA